MSDSIVILPARVEWAESFRLCLDSVARENDYFLMAEAPPLIKIHEFLSRLNTVGHSHYFALTGSTVVGWCNVKRMETIGRNHVGELSMGIRLEYRGLGIGRKLMEACLRESRFSNYHKIELTVFSDNLRAIRLYRSIGFEKEGHLKDYAAAAGGYRDAYLMGLIL